MPGLKTKPKSKLVEAVGKIERHAPPWAGPCGEGPQGGVTQSLICRYLACKERFRVLVIEGLKPADRFEPNLEFGNLWHAAEEAHAANGSWEDGMAAYRAGLDKRFPFERDKVLHWWSVASELFPRYAEHWAKHPDVKERTPLLQEQEFDVPYLLPSGRIARLRGKWDSVDLIGKGKGAGVWLQENKTKGAIDGMKIRRQLTFDLQTMTYLTALGEDHKADCEGPGQWDWISDRLGKVIGPDSLVGVRYNAVRRAAHKSTGSMLAKLEEDRNAGRIEEWFARWQVKVSAADIQRFKRECLEPVLENLCDDFEWFMFCAQRDESQFNFTLREEQFSHRGPRHFRTPYMGYNPLGEGGFGDVDSYLETGSTAGLQRVKDLFPELGQKSVNRV
jgi:hypothetical protein